MSARDPTSPQLLLIKMVGRMTVQVCNVSLLSHMYITPFSLDGLYDSNKIDVPLWDSIINNDGNSSVQLFVLGEGSYCRIAYRIHNEPDIKSPLTIPHSSNVWILGRARYQITFDHISCIERLNFGHPFYSGHSSNTTFLASLVKRHLWSESQSHQRIKKWTVSTLRCPRDDVAQYRPA